MIVLGIIFLIVGVLMFVWANFAINEGDWMGLFMFIASIAFLIAGLKCVGLI